MTTKELVEYAESKKALSEKGANGYVTSYWTGYKDGVNATLLAETPLDWTPCAEGQNLPTKNDAYLVTIRESKSGDSWTTTLRFMNGRWMASENYKVLAWMKPEPYNPDHIREATKKVDSDDVSQWPDWKKRAALCNYEPGKKETE